MAMLRRLVLGLALVGAIEGVQPDLDCGRPAAGQEMIGRLRLAEMEWKEDVNRVAMWEAFGRCSTRPGAAACREGEREQFDADWADQDGAMSSGVVPSIDS